MNETTRELLEKGNQELFEASRRANEIIGQQADEMKQLQDTVDRLEAKNLGLEQDVAAGRAITRAIANELLVQQRDDLRKALKAAVSSGTYVVQLCETNTEGPGGRHEWSAATVAHCYAAMSFVGQARKILEETNEIEYPKDEASAGSYCKFPTTSEAIGGL